MTIAFIWHQKVKNANLQLPNVMLKDREVATREKLCKAELQLNSSLVLNLA